MRVILSMSLKGPTAYRRQSIEVSLESLLQLHWPKNSRLGQEIGIDSISVLTTMRIADEASVNRLQLLILFKTALRAKTLCLMEVSHNAGF